MNPLLLESLALKHLDREGWRRVGISHPESVAAHSWGMCWLVMVLATDEIDKSKAIELAVIHDLAEARIGDITPHDGISKAEKRKRESKAITEMLADRPDLLDLWQEYEDNETPEAKFVHDMDRLDMALQARVYSSEFGVDTQEFLDSALKTIHDRDVEALIKQLATP